MAEQWASIPSWQISELQTLSNQGLLSGVDPHILAAISAEESGGEVKGAGFNPSGYGGYFGLGTGPYPGGHQVSQQTLLTNSPASFIAQAETAAAAFNSYLKEAGGSILGAETIYQSGHLGGSAPGVGVFQSLGIGGSLSPGAVSPGSGGVSNVANASLTAAGGNTGALPTSTIGKILAQIDGLFNPKYSTGNLVTAGLSTLFQGVVMVLVRTVTAGAGVIFIVMGVRMMTRSSNLGAIELVQRQQYEARQRRAEVRRTYQAETERGTEARQYAQTFGTPESTGPVTGTTVPPVFA